MGAWQDYATLVGVRVAVKPLPNPWGISLSHWLWPYPGGKLAYVFTVMLSLNVALAAYVLVRRFYHVGYSIGWGRGWGFFFFAGFIVFGGIPIPLGEGVAFLHFAAPRVEANAMPFLAIPT